MPPGWLAAALRDQDALLSAAVHMEIIRLSSLTVIPRGIVMPRSSHPHLDAVAGLPVLRVDEPLLPEVIPHGELWGILV